MGADTSDGELGNAAVNENLSKAKGSGGAVEHITKIGNRGDRDFMHYALCIMICHHVTNSVRHQ